MKKIAIVCGAPNSEFLAPFNDPEWEIWALGNRLDKFLSRNLRVTRIFEIHNDLAQHTNGYPEWLASHKIPLVVGGKFPIKADHIKAFPFDEAKKLFGSTYLTSSSAYMMALALLEGATHIGVYGVSMAVNDLEYFWQRPCMEAWIGFAKGRGVEVIIPDVSPVLKSDYVEGEEGSGKPDFSLPPFTQEQFLVMAERHADKIRIKSEQIAMLQRDINTHDGARQAYEQMARVARGVEAGNKLEKLTDATETV